jgi:AcrR family transcriptional regulator
MSEQEKVNTEEKIKESARKLFLKKGFAATTTREIAEDAGINLALLNYYFRSKKKLFDIIMIEKLLDFAEGMKGVVNDPETDLERKLEQMVEAYTDMMIREPDLPVFLISELKQNAGQFLEKLPFDVIRESLLARQILEYNLPFPPINILMNAMAMTIFPVMTEPIVRKITSLDHENYLQLLESRKKLIPKWIMMQVTANGRK